MARRRRPKWVSRDSAASAACSSYRQFRSKTALASLDEVQVVVILINFCVVRDDALQLRRSRVHPEVLRQEQIRRIVVQQLRDLPQDRLPLARVQLLAALREQLIELWIVVVLGRVVTSEPVV